MSLGRFILSVPGGAVQLGSDDFNRANETPLASPWLIVGTVTATANLSTNTVVANNGGLDFGYYYSSVTWPDNQYSEAAITVTGTTAGTGYGVLARGDVNGGALTYYRAVVSKAASNNVDLSKFVGGTKTAIGSRTTTWVDGDVFRIEVTGSTISLKQNGTILGATFSDSGIATGRAGIIYSSQVTSGNIGNWAGGSL
jgi:hypothetical protein